MAFKLGTTDLVTIGVLLQFEIERRKAEGESIARLCDLRNRIQDELGQRDALGAAKPQAGTLKN